MGQFRSVGTTILSNPKELYRVWSDLCAGHTPVDT